MTLSKKALKVIAYELLLNSGSLDILKYRHAGLKTMEEIESFVFEITGEKMEQFPKHQRDIQLIKNYVNSIHTPYKP